MRTAGVAVAMASRGRPTTYLVIADDSGGTVRIYASDKFPADASADLATRLLDTAEAVRSRLQGLEVARAVVRRADRPRQANNKDGPRFRLLMEGAVTSAARGVVVDTVIGTGADTGAWYGTSKRDLDSAAGRLVADAGLHEDYTEAASAALAALRRP